MPYRARDRSAAVELACELLTTGRVRGVPPAHDPADLDAVLGPARADVPVPGTGLTMIRDYGVLEVTYGRPAPDAPWRAHLYAAQMYWLAKPVRWRDLARAVRRQGWTVTGGPDPGLGASYYRVDGSGSTATVNLGHSPRWPRGHVAKVFSSARPPIPPGAVRDFAEVHRDVYAAVTRPAAAPPGWLDDADRLRTAGHAVAVVVREHPGLAARAAAVHDRLMDRGAALWPADEQAFRTAEFAAEHPGLPHRATVDELAARCLAALPITREEAAALPGPWREWTPAGVRAAKMTGALIRCARDLAPGDPAVRAGLAAWEPLLPCLC